MNTRIAVVGLFVAGVFSLAACAGAEDDGFDTDESVDSTTQALGDLTVTGIAPTTTTTTTTISTKGTYCKTCGTTVSKPKVQYSYCSPVAVDSYGLGKSEFLGNSRVARVTKNSTTGASEVPCVHMEKGSRASCQVNSKSAPWFKGKDGNVYMKTGWRIDTQGNPDGDYVISAAVESGRVPCVDPSARDTAGVAYGTELAAACVVEVLNAPSNASGKVVQNYATQKVCTSSYPHPDESELLKGTYYCYAGEGAGLNDINGTERDMYGVYYPDADHCHVSWISGVEAPAAKRPATKSFPAPGVAISSSPILWRPVAARIAIAN